MNLNLKNPIAFIDLETTGVNVAKDRIVEISIVKVSPNGDEEVKTYRVNPGMPIPKYASDVHGIKDEDVVNEPGFKGLDFSNKRLRICKLMSGWNESVR